MRSWWLSIALQIALSFGSAAQSQYEAIENYLHIPSQFGVMLGQVVGLAVDNEDDLYVFHRNGRVWDLSIKKPFPLDAKIVLRFDQGGEYLGSHASQIVLPHMIEVDPNGHIWLVDVSQQVIFFASSTESRMTYFGERFVPGNDTGHFDLPTDVTVLKDGSFYISDGYQNSRIIKFSADGKFQFQWGRKGTGDGEFNIPHSVKYFDGKVYVADRENSRLQVFDANGKFLTKYDVGEKIGRLFAVTVDKKGNIYLSGMKEQGGGTLILTPDMRIKAELPTGGHDIAVDSKGVVYVTKDNNVTKFIPR